MTRARPLTAVLGLALVLVLTTGGYLGWSGWKAREHLEQARVSAGGLASPGSLDRPEQVREGLREARRHTARARSLTTTPLWDLAGRVPLLGRTPRTVSAVTRAADDVMRDVLPPAVTAMEVASAPGTGTSNLVDVGRLAQAAPPLRDAARRAEHVRGTLAALPETLVPGAVSDGRRALLAQLDNLVPALRLGAAGAQVAPSMLGAGEPRRYFVALQNTAEARGNGGLVGAFAVVVVQDGRLDLERVGSDRDLLDPDAEHVRSTPEHTRRYAEYSTGSQWLNANLSPHFPDAARIWSGLWQRQTGQHVDGVLALDPAVLDSLLAATGPVRLPDGSTVRAGEAAALTMSQAYARYSDQLERKAFLVGLVPAVLEHLASVHVPPVDVARALAPAARDGRVRLYSSHPQEQELLERTPLGGALPSTPAPFAMAAVNNAFGNKLDYYLDRHVDYALGACTGGTRPSRVTVTLTNGTPEGLGDYVTGRVDRVRRGRDHAYGHHRVLVSVFATAGARLQAATLDGRVTTLRRFVERGHPVYDVYVDLPRGGKSVLTLDLLEPARPEQPQLARQPLVRPQTGGVTGGPCTVTG